MILKEWTGATGNNENTKKGHQALAIHGGKSILALLASSAHRRSVHHNGMFYRWETSPYCG